MNGTWTNSIEQLWHSPSLPVWLTLAAAVFFGIVVLIVMLRADRSVANATLAVITLLALVVAMSAALHVFAPEPGGPATRAAASPPSISVVSLPALACIDELADDTVLTACEKALFASPEAVAAAVSYAAVRLSRLTALGDVATANANMTPELASLRASIERDRYGLFAHVLAVRDHCQANDCAAYASLADHNQIAANIDARAYEAAVERHAPSWNQAAVPALSGLAGLPVEAPSGKPTTADFPTADSIPPVNIMTPEPPLAAAPPPQPKPTPKPKPAEATLGRPAPPSAAQAPRPAAAKKPPRPKPHLSAPVQLTPAASDDKN
ncbi:MULTISPECIES: polysulfide reductase NrfD [Rhodopseudomonas]|uniref:Uncharacterized protein n=1 Tax=Rhodopseudomonas palustris TaxID=1076 RepID=A0A0D7E4T6_RHOPL|nr:MULTISPECIES: polysulfide reductase NrfD [Rhodopseudomonas]KIZ34597.1 hypothetical protein OO17_26590 [Rhodopseudomonas palustris]WOK19379.1 polysulfide reductase NrfD [Rhodopseudomonas sp. BAL398]